MSSSEDESDASSSPPPETLVAGRAKRATAGNRLSALIQHLDDEDIKADLLAEEEDDQKDYSASEDGDADGGLDSSSDDSDDEAKDGAAQELAGEVELMRQERIASKKKRKARELVRIQPLKKKAKISHEVVSADAQQETQQDTPRAIHRLALADLAPTRQSSRSQTVASAKVTEAKVKESRRKAERTQEVMRIAAEKKAARAGPKLTQQDRMARALRLEKENSRSLNRWEKSEQERLRTQQEKLEAMRNRKLEGPVIKYWSGPVTWFWRQGPDGPLYARCKYKIEELDEEEDRLHDTQQDMHRSHDRQNKDVPEIKLAAPEVEITHSNEELGPASTTTLTPTPMDIDKEPSEMEAAQASATAIETPELPPETKEASLPPDNPLAGGDPSSFLEGIHSTLR